MQTEDDTKILKQIELSLMEYAFSDIKKSREKNMLIASFILCFCLIGQLSVHRYFKNHKLNNDHRKFKEFLKSYFGSEYQPYADALYIDLRSKLVHNYSGNGKFSLSDERREWHLAVKNNKIFLNIDVFISDIENALNKYLRELNDDDIIGQIAIAHYKKWKILSSNNLT